MRRAHLLRTLAALSLTLLGHSAAAQPRVRPTMPKPANTPIPAPTPAGNAPLSGPLQPVGTPPPAPPPSPSPPAAAAAPAPTPPVPTKPGVTGPLANGKMQADTSGLTQFDTGMEFEPRSPNYKVGFNLDDADLSELVRTISEITGKRFIFGGKVRNIKATVYSPQKVTVAEAYQAFLSILETNGLTVVPHGRFLKIIETPGVATQNTPLFVAGQAATTEDRYITRIHRLTHVSAEEVAGILGKFKTKDADISVYGPGNLLIITDTGSNIRRMMQLLEDIDVGGVGDQVWIEPVHYGVPSELATRLNEVFEVKPRAAGDKAAAGVPSVGSGDMHIARIVGDDRAQALVIVATEKGYLRILEFVKRVDAPHSGEGEIHVLALQHADATELAKTLNEIITGAASAAGGQASPAKGTTALTGIFESGIKVSADKATNAIVITSSLRDYAALYNVIEKLDQPRRQVFIEAVIMDLNISHIDSFGVSYHAGGLPSLGGDGSSPSLAFGGFNPLNTLGLPGSLINPANNLAGLALGVKGFGIPGSQNILGTGLSIPAFGTLISAIATVTDSDLLSTPHVIATDNIPAEINVGSNIPLQTNSTSISSLAGAAGGAAGGLGALGALGGFGAAPQRQDIGTKIKITPHLNDSNEVRLEVQEEISDTTGLAPVGSLGVQPFAKRTLNTSVIVRDQEPVVLGGLVKNQITHSEQKIPLLGDIPVLGALFRSTSSQIVKSNLILVLTPYIIREQSDLKAVFERKMNERQEFLDHYFVFGDHAEYEPPHDYSRTNGLLEEIRQSMYKAEEHKRLEQLTRPKLPKTHEPGLPIELPHARMSGTMDAETASQADRQPSPQGNPPPAAGGATPPPPPPPSATPPTRHTPARMAPPGRTGADNVEH